MNDHVYNRIPGVDICLNFTEPESDIEIGPECDPDGFLGDFPSDRILLDAGIRLTVGIEKEYNNIYGFSVDHKKNVIPKKNLIPSEHWPYATPGRHGKLYKLKVNIYSICPDGVVVNTTKYPQNNMRLLEILNNGFCKIWEIGLVSQSGKFFLTVQNSWSVRCYYDDDGKFHCPRFENAPHRWPQMVKWLSEVFSKQTNLQVENFAHYNGESEMDVTGLKDNESRVIFWNDASQTGAIMTKDGAAKVHWSGVVSSRSRAYLVPGEVVKYESLRKTMPGLTSFKWEAEKVSPLEALPVAVK